MKIVIKLDKLSRKMVKFEARFEFEKIAKSCRKIVKFDG